MKSLLGGKVINANHEAKMASLEQQVKDRYARIFKQSDWHLFKDIAEYDLHSAAFLRMKDIKHTPYQKLVRNIRKRLSIGIACELLLKALYLKQGYVINMPKDGTNIAANKPYKFSDVNLADFNKYRTLELNYLIQQLHNVQVFAKQDVVIRGLTIGKVFRNKEGHVVIDTHAYHAQEYTDVEQALIEFYKEVFGERLVIQISMESGEPPRFKVEPLP